ncbi:hypothetical protein EDC04DRAFT_439249 [Pisolithus marmoratus]|nr:hypothetical protein EDC04DRAFT_439249 [Pisolithus marmoratus]
MFFELVHGEDERRRNWSTRMNRVSGMRHDAGHAIRIQQETAVTDCLSYVGKEEVAVSNHCYMLRVVSTTAFNLSKVMDREELCQTRQDPSLIMIFTVLSTLYVSTFISHPFPASAIVRVEKEAGHGKTKCCWRLHLGVSTCGEGKTRRS